MRICFVLLAALLFCAPARAIDSEPPFNDPALQDRYQTLIHGFRCLVCQDEAVADSDADLAADFRRQIHAMVAEGKSDAEIKGYMVERYGNYVLYKPPVQASTWLLWTGPFILLCIALLTVVTVVRRRASQSDAAAGGEP
ncbi:MAG TPA: cytochrome c-type biogenesis protein [Gammaproteobacteria bacterium]|nr:cytochrome c-type biogenesis protein [Gammaproteobacteria bacterium]